MHKISTEMCGVSSDETLGASARTSLAESNERSTCEKFSANHDPFRKLHSTDFGQNKIFLAFRGALTFKVNF